MRYLSLAALTGILFLASAPVRAQVPCPAPPYLVPDGYGAFGPGTPDNFSGYIYGDGTMLVAAQPLPAPPPVQLVAYDPIQMQYIQPATPYVQPVVAYNPVQGFGMASWQGQPGWGAGYAPNQMGAYTYQPVNYQGHNGYLVQGNMNGHPYQGLFTSPPHHHH
jgi:hypothetical protein